MNAFNDDAAYNMVAVSATVALYRALTLPQFADERH